MRQVQTEYGQTRNCGSIHRYGLLVAALVFLPGVSRAEDVAQTQDGATVQESPDSEAVESTKAVETIEAAIWKPKVYQFSRYQKMLAKAPFGKPPAKGSPPPAPVGPPKEEKQLAIAGVSVVKGKPVVYLIDLKTRAYQKINAEEENESGIRLVEISEEANPRDVVAKVAIGGQMATVKYDTGVLNAKLKKVAKKKGRPVNVAANRAAQAKRAPQAITTSNPALTQNANPALGNNRPAPTTGGGVMPQAANRGITAAGGQAPVPVIRSIQDQRRLSAVPRRRVIVPGQNAQPQLVPAKAQTPAQQ